MLPVDRIRFNLVHTREHLPEGTERKREVELLLADALIEERRNTGSGTDVALRERYGFTAEEIAAHSRAALDEATRRFVRGNMVDPVAVAA